MTAYYVKMKSKTGREFTRCFDSMVGRTLFLVDAEKYGATLIAEWIESGPMSTYCEEL